MTHKPKRLPILMYHSLSVSHADGLTMPAARLERQFRHLREQGYTTISFSDLKAWMETGHHLPKKPVILTFDDAYESFLTFAHPLLVEYHMKATLFVPVAYIGKTNSWDHGDKAILTVDQLKHLQEEGLTEIGVHSFLHRSYADLTPEEIDEDLQNCFRTLEYHHIRTSRVLAYPYGSYPKRDPERKQRMKEVLAKYSIWFALRIGNRVNRLPLTDIYEVKRIDLKGTDTYTTFRMKMMLGRKHPFV